jgi:hypothetical protein
MVKKSTDGYEEIVGKRSIAGHISRILFWGYNLLMVIWVWGGLNATVGQEGNLGTAESIGVGIGITMIVFVWVLGDIILGLFYFFTRPTRQLVKK